MFNTPFWTWASHVGVLGLAPESIFLLMSTREAAGWLKHSAPRHPHGRPGWSLWSKPANGTSVCLTASQINLSKKHTPGKSPTSLSSILKTSAPVIHSMNDPSVENCEG